MARPRTATTPVKVIAAMRVIARVSNGHVGRDGIRAEGHLGDDYCERAEIVERRSQREGSEWAQPEHRIFDGGSETERLSSDSMNAPDGRDVVPDHLRIHEREEEQVQAEDQELKESEAGRHRFEEQ